MGHGFAEVALLTRHGIGAGHHKKVTTCLSRQKTFGSAAYHVRQTFSTADDAIGLPKVVLHIVGADTFTSNIPNSILTKLSWFSKLSKCLHYLACVIINGIE